MSEVKLKQYAGDLIATTLVVKFSDYDALTAQRDEGLLREKELRVDLDSERHLKTMYRNQRDEGLAREAELRSQIKALVGFLPVPSQVNALPEGIRQYVSSLQTLCDPSGIVAENTLLRDQTKQLDAMIGRLKQRLAEAEKIGECGERNSTGLRTNYAVGWNDCLAALETAIASPGCADGEKAQCPAPEKCTEGDHS